MESLHWYNFLNYTVKSTVYILGIRNSELTHSVDVLFLFQSSANKMYPNFRSTLSCLQKVLAEVTTLCQTQTTYHYIFILNKEHIERRDTNFFVLMNVNCSTQYELEF